MKIKIIASLPKYGQEGIESLIGNVYEAKDEDDGCVSVEEEKLFRGTIILNPGEFELCQSPSTPAPAT